SSVPTALTRSMHGSKMSTEAERSGARFECPLRRDSAKRASRSNDSKRRSPLKVRRPARTTHPPSGGYLEQGFQRKLQSMLHRVERNPRHVTDLTAIAYFAL